MRLHSCWSAQYHTTQPWCMPSLASHVSRYMGASSLASRPMAKERITLITEHRTSYGCGLASCIAILGSLLMYGAYVAIESHTTLMA